MFSRVCYYLRLSALIRKYLYLGLYSQYNVPLLRVQCTVLNNFSQKEFFKKTTQINFFLPPPLLVNLSITSKAHLGTWEKTQSEKQSENTT